MDAGRVGRLRRTPMVKHFNQLLAKQFDPVLFDLIGIRVPFAWHPWRATPLRTLTKWVPSSIDEIARFSRAFLYHHIFTVPKAHKNHE